ncbi:SEC14-like protein 2 isoform X2 [Zootermopsis nevadensis]|uniref:SEC14-like protein 2 n=2 Tax=Zootermopsis nevadensis TaxID=136037 RepID=A0A067R8V3_ZOONE|nr:SEC14-like protein 2 isoform X2 [Zootermopsis nevadensis]XP_021918751.1 SEC14-like protein 2 isoform X2 [Zootermopsis nevadensis]KDR20081.1 SEC14-like protein 2 [Zootermopsis nevadensis]
MLRDSLKWRENLEVEKLKDWEPPEVIQKYYPSGISGYDKDGAPVIIVPFAGLDMWGMMHCISKADFIKMTIKTLELYLSRAREQAQKFGQEASKVVVIMDMENFNLRQYAWRPAGEAVMALLQMYEANYPEILKACYIINAPKVFAIAFSVVKNFLNEYTLQKIQIIASDPRKWQPLLLKLIESDQLPAHFGGTQTDPDGNPRYTTEIHQGGKIPKSYYAKKTDKTSPPANDTFTTVVIKKGEKLSLPFIAPVEQSILKWEFRSEDHDIKFGIMCKDVNGIESTAVPLHKVNSHQSDEIGFITCPAPATYTVIFDNTNSYIRNKKLHYAITMVSPPTVKDEDDDEIILQD